MLNWNDLRVFLAVARTGSTLAAGRQLRVSQTTAARRIAALEAALGVILFERRPAGYALTAEGAALLDDAVAVADAAAAFEAAANARRRRARGVVRLTTTELYATTVLAPILRDLHAALPLIELELDTSDEPLDLGAGAADVALRLTHAAGGGGLVGRRIADDPWAIYCSPAYAERHGLPRTRSALHGHELLGGGGSTVWPVFRQWLSENGLERAVGVRHGSLISLLSAVRAGAGLGVLPRLVAASEPALLRCLPPAPGKAMELWLLTHERVRHAPPVRAVIDFLYARLTAVVRALDEAEA